MNLAVQRDISIPTEVPALSSKTEKILQSSCFALATLHKKIKAHI